MLAGSYLSASILTILLPIFARIDYLALIACRFVIGLAHVISGHFVSLECTIMRLHLKGIVWPSFAGFWASWAPPNERSRLIGLANAGAQIGNVKCRSFGNFDFSAHSILFLGHHTSTWRLSLCLRFRRWLGIYFLHYRYERYKQKALLLTNR